MCRCFPVGRMQLGAGMELFMLKTGFYEKVTELEATRLEETREEREAFLAQVKRVPGKCLVGDEHPGFGLFGMCRGQVQWPRRCIPLTCAAALRSKGV